MAMSHADRMNAVKALLAHALAAHAASISQPAPMGAAAPGQMAPTTPPGGPVGPSPQLLAMLRQRQMMNQAGPQGLAPGATAAFPFGRQ